VILTLPLVQQPLLHTQLHQLLGIKLQRSNP